MMFGYVRVSTEDQDFETQKNILVSYGCNPNFIFSDKLSGKSADKRMGLLECIERLREGDILIAKHVDRIARNMSDLMWILRLVEQKKAHIKIVDSNLDTTTRDGRQLFYYRGIFAEFELDLRSSRTMDGIKRAKALGKYKGGNNQKIDREVAAAMLKRGASLSEVAKLFGVTSAAVSLFKKQSGLSGYSYIKQKNLDIIKSRSKYASS